MIAAQLRADQLQLLVPYLYTTAWPMKIFVVGLRIGEEMCVIGSKCHFCMFRAILTGDTRKIFVSNICFKYLFQIFVSNIYIFKTVDESHSARVLIGCKPIRAITLLFLVQSVIFVGNLAFNK